jgi:hypothetical protein
MRSRDHVLHDVAACRLQWPHSASGQEPHAFVFVAAINNVDPVARHRVMKCGAGIFGNESKESFAPWVIGIMENLFEGGSSQLTSRRVMWVIPTLFSN